MLRAAETYRHYLLAVRTLSSILRANPPVSLGNTSTAWPLTLQVLFDKRKAISAVILQSEPRYAIPNSGPCHLSAMFLIPTKPATGWQTPWQSRKIGRSKP